MTLCSVTFFDLEIVLPEYFFSHGSSGRKQKLTLHMRNLHYYYNLAIFQSVSCELLIKTSLFCIIYYLKSNKMQRKYFF